MTIYFETPAWAKLIAECYTAKDELFDAFEKLFLLRGQISESNTVKTAGEKETSTALGDTRAVYCSDLKKPLLLTMVAEPKDDGFDYGPGGSGFSFPIDEIGALLFYNAKGELLFSFTGLSLTFEELFSFETLGELTDALLGGDDSMTLADFNHVAHGFDGIDRIFGGAGHDKLFGDGGNDVLSGGDGNDQVSGGKGDDNVSGGAGKDTVKGDAGADRVDGGSENDTLSGGSGGDTVIGWTGKDKMNGGSGDDLLYGYEGADTMTGGGGADKFVYNGLIANESGPSASTQDLITDFKPGTDKIDVSFMLGADSFKYLGEKAAFTGANQIRWEHDGKNTVVFITTDTDPAPEFIINLKGTLDLTKGDFVL